MLGATHIVISGVGSMICDTVMNGVLYTSESIINLVDKLKGKTIHAPSSHPEDNDGNFILAGAPEAIAQNYVGAFAFNYRMDGDRLIHDLAINPEIAQRSDDGKEILRRIESNMPIDTSTGVLVYDYSDDEGYGKCGTKYNMIAKAIDLDHDAILLHEQGAATNKQGVGVFANAGKLVDVDICTNSSIANIGLDISDIAWDENGAVSRVREFTGSQKEPTSNYRRFFMFFDKSSVSDFDSYLFPFVDIVDGKPVAIKEAIIAAKKALEASTLSVDDKEDSQSCIDAYMERIKTTGMIGNAWRYIKSALFGNNKEKEITADLIKLELNKAFGANDNCAWPVEILANYFIYEKKGGKLYKQCYNTSGNNICFNGEAEEVSKDTTYKPIQKGDKMKDMIIEALVAAGVDVEGMSDEALLTAYSVLLGDSASAVNADEEAKAAEDEEVKANEGELTAEVVAKMITDALSKALQKNADEEKETETEVMANKVATILGINKAAAKAMGLPALRKIAASNGVMAFNASSINANSYKTQASEMPD